MKYFESRTYGEVLSRITNRIVDTFGYEDVEPNEVINLTELLLN